MQRARSFSALIQLFALAVAVGCRLGDRTAEAGAVSVDTVGGIIRVRNPPGESQDTATVQTIIGAVGTGAASTPDEFGRINSIVLDEDGKIFVADGMAREVRVFSPAGQFLHAFGRPGNGPGEFPSLSSLAWLGDTLIALSTARISTFTSSGVFQEHWPWLPITGPPDFVRFYPAGPHDAYVLGLMPNGAGGNAFIHLSAGGPQETVVVPTPPEQTSGGLRCPTPDGGISFFSVPFAPRRIVAPAPDGLVAQAWSSDYRVGFTTAAGDTVRVVERDYSPLPISDADWQNATQEFREFRQRQPDVRCDPIEMDRRSHKAAIEGIFFTNEGQLVVEVTSPAGTRYDFFDSMGLARATVLAPARDRSVAPYFRGNRALQVVRDGAQIQYVQLLALSSQQ